MTSQELQDEIKRLESLLQEKTNRLQEAQDTLDAIRSGAVDGLVRSTAEGDQVFLLKGSDAPYRNLIEQMNEGALLVSETGIILFCNFGFARLVDAPLEKIMGSNIKEWVNPSSTFSVEMLSHKSEPDKRLFEVAFKTTKQQLVPTQLSVNKISLDSINASALIVTDLTKHMETEVKRYTANLEKEITERKKAEASLRESEERLKMAQQVAHVGTFEWNIQTGVNKWTPELEAMYGLAPGTFAGTQGAWEQLVYPEDRPEMVKRVSEAEVKGSFEGEWRTVWPDGSIHWIMGRAWLFKDAAGKPSRLIGINLDITAPKKNEEALKKLNEELETRVQERTREVSLERKRLFETLNSLPVIISVLNKNHKYSFINQMFKDTFGNPQDSECHKYLFKNEEPCKWCQAYEPLKTGKPHYWRLECPNGTIFDVYNSIVKDTDGSDLILEVDIDITERMRLEKQLKDSERMAAIGQVAGMVGHDIRNPLQAIVGELYFAKETMKELPQENAKSALESMDFIQEQTDYISKIVADLQDYARALKPDFKSVDLCQFISDTVKPIIVPGNIMTAFFCENQNLQVELDKTFTTRILTNLINNAIQAMPKGGKLTVTALKQVDTAVITVEDTGVGIPEDVKAKLFTPLFTTKSKGQGFGLPVVKRLVEAQGGTINFESEAGEGTKFTVTLPLTR